jgi:hypothetical protein
MKKALLIGINYIGTSSELKGCIQDVNQVEFFLKNNRNYKDITIITDLTPIKPTYDNILNAMTELTRNVKPGDELWFHYSGHGTLVADNNGDEVTGQDSALCPLDYERRGCIRDDLIRSILADKICIGATLYGVLDCCHSGSGCDLRYTYQDNSSKKTFSPDRKYLYNEWNTSNNTVENKRYSKTAGEVYFLSGCMDTQTSADAVEENRPTGALTYYFIKTLKNNYGNPKWKHLIKDLRVSLQLKGYTQVPMLTSGRALFLDNTMFSNKSIGQPSILI